MSKNTHKVFAVIITFVLIVFRVLADYEIEENVNQDTNEEQLFSDNEETEINESIEENNLRKTKIEPLITKKGLQNERSTEGNINRETVQKDTNEKINTHIYKQKPNENTHEILTQFKETRKPLWKINKTDKKRETGFDLTSAEQKRFKIWHRGVIPYYIDDVSFSDKVLRDRIRNQLQLVNYAAGLNFVELPGPPSDDNERWVFFVNRRGLLGCGDHSVRSFTNQGFQQVVLGYDCIETRGEISEAVMSIVGVPAQHNAPDRDKYIHVSMENIMPDKKYLFEKLEDDEWLFHDLEYDFNSITHYDVYKYSANGRPTIQPKNMSTDIGLAKELSRNDLLKIKMLYNYMAKNLTIRSECEKLFQPRSKLPGFVPDKVLMTPRNKPSRYLNNRNNHMPLSATLYRHQQYVKSLLERYLHNQNKSQTKSKNEYIKIRSKENESIYNVTPYIEVTKFPDTFVTTRKKKKPYNKIGKLEALEILSDYQSDN